MLALTQSSGFHYPTHLGCQSLLWVATIHKLFIKDMHNCLGGLTYQTHKTCLGLFAGSQHHLSQCSSWQFDSIGLYQHQTDNSLLSCKHFKVS